MPRIACVTGASGFLASELVSQLLSRGYTVQATVRSLASTTKLAYLTELPNAANNLRLFEADLLAEGAFDGCVAGADVIFGQGDGATFGMLQAVETTKSPGGGNVWFIDVIGDKTSIDKGHGGCGVGLVHG